MNTLPLLLLLLSAPHLESTNPTAFRTEIEMSALPESEQFLMELKIFDPSLEEGKQLVLHPHILLSKGHEGEVTAEKTGNVFSVKVLVMDSPKGPILTARSSVTRDGQEVWYENRRVLVQ